MIERKAFYYALIISFGIHLGLIIVLSLKKAELESKKSKKVEITFEQIKLAKQEPPLTSIKKIDFSKQREDQVSKVDILSKKSGALDSMESSIKETNKFAKDVLIERKLAPKLDSLGIERKIDVPMLKSEKITNPKYLSYNETIRQKIRQRAYTYIENPDFEAGEVYLTFMVASNGTLVQVKVIEEKTKGSRYVRSIGIRSIQESSPFPPFPKDLNYPELTFNVVISFKLNK